MGCGCGGKKASFKAAIAKASTPATVQPSKRVINIIDTPDEFLNPRQLFIKNRHFRIMARNERIKRRNALADAINEINQEKPPKTV